MQEWKKMHSVKVGSFELCVCDLKWLYFNEGGGTANSYIETSKKPSELLLDDDGIVFRCGGFDGQQGTPAWKLDAAVAFSDVPNNDTTFDNWRVGFIQSIEFIHWEALYENGWGRKLMVNKSRDGDKEAFAPWYAPEGANGEPRPLDDIGKIGKHPTLSDDPYAHLAFAHKDAPCQKLVGATMKGAFNLWLVAIDKNAPLSESQVKFLYNASITVDKKWELTNDYGGVRSNLASWKCTGKQTKTESPGKGSKIPILTGSVPNEHPEFGTHLRGAPCPPGALKTPTRR